MPHIHVIQPEDAEGQLKEIYDGLKKSRGKIAEVHKIQSLNPKSIINHMELYMTIMFGQSPIKRVHREMMAVVVSRANECEYCQTHHIEAVNNFWKDDDRAKKLKEDFHTAGLNEKEFALASYAHELTLHPEKSEEKEYALKLKNGGFSDREILDATLVIAYFNFVNRIVLSLGLDLEENAGGYKYE